MKVAIYARVSTVEQAEKHSIEAQIDTLRDFAEKNKYLIVKEYVDAGYSGTIDERPGYQELLNDVLNKKIECILIYKLDRLFRSTRQLLNVIFNLEQESVSVISATEPFDTSTSLGKFMLQIIASFAEFERNMFMERTTLGRMKRLQKGLHWGKAPFGYNYCLETSKLEINEIEAQVVSKIFDEYTEPNSSLLKVVSIVNGLGLKTKEGKKWTSDRVHDILIKSCYTGTFIYNKTDKDGNIKDEKKWIKSDCPEIIQTEKFNEAQALLKKRRNHHSGGNTKHNYLLRGLFYCAECGSTMGGTSETYSKTIKGKEYGPYSYQYYRCMGRALAHRDSTKDFKKKNCKMSQIKSDVVEPIIWDAVLNVISNPEIIKDALQNKESDCKVENRITEINKVLKSLHKEKEKLLSLYRKDLINFTDLESQLNDIKEQESYLSAEEEEIKETLNQKIKEEEVISSIEPLVYLLTNKLKKLSFNERINTIGLIIKRIEVNLEGELTIKFALPLLNTEQHVFGEQHMESATF